MKDTKSIHPYEDKDPQKSFTIVKNVLIEKGCVEIICDGVITPLEAE